MKWSPCIMDYTRRGSCRTAVCSHKRVTKYYSSDYCSVKTKNPTLSTKVIMGHKNNLDKKDFDFLQGFHDGLQQKES